MKKNQKIRIIFFIFLPLLIEFFLQQKLSINKSSILRISFCYFIYILIGLFLILKKNSKKINLIVDKMIKYRYLIATIVFIILVIFKINFSSIGNWANFLGENDYKNKEIGTSRAIRSDEWLVQSPILLGQTENGKFDLYNEKIAQGNLNMIMATAPVWDITTISRPLTWGFLLFGKEYGFAFYWAFKLIGLIMVALEISLKITKKDKLLGITGALLLGIAPAMIWWMSTAVVDAFIFGGAVIILFSYYMENLNWKIWKKLLIALGILIFLPAFAMTLYPAIQVPFAFVMAIFMIIDLSKNWKNLKAKDFIIMISTIILSFGIIARFIIISWKDIQIMLNTVYPGKRFEQGGTFGLDSFISYFYNIFFPYTKRNINFCESSSYIYPFIGLVIMLIIASTQKKEDDNKNKKVENKLFYSLITLLIIFFIWEFIGFNKILSKITFMYFSPPTRTHIIFGILGIMLILMVMKKLEGKKIFTKKQSIIISTIVTTISYIAIKKIGDVNFFTPVKLEIWFCIIFSMTYFLISINKKAFCYVMCLIAIIAGATINPVCIGTDILYETEIAKTIQEINKKDENALWVGNTNITGQYLVANGIKTLNGVNSYPNFKWLNIVDEKGEFANIYNRYAHILIDLGHNTNFELLGQDIYKATLTFDDIKKIGIKYYFSNIKINDNIIKEFNLKTIYENNNKNQYIYEFIY